MSDEAKPYTLADLDRELSPYGGARGEALAHYMGDLDPYRVLATVEAADGWRFAAEANMALAERNADTIDRLCDERDALRAALEEIARGKSQDDVGCLADEWMLMSGRLVRIARAALSGGDE